MFSVGQSTSSHEQPDVMEAFARAVVFFVTVRTVVAHQIDVGGAATLLPSRLAKRHRVGLQQQLRYGFVCYLFEYCHMSYRYCRTSLVVWLAFISPVGRSRARVGFALSVIGFTKCAALQARPSRYPAVVLLYAFFVVLCVVV